MNDRKHFVFYFIFMSNVRAGCDDPCDVFILKGE